MDSDCADRRPALLLAMAVGTTNEMAAGKCLMRDILATLVQIGSNYSDVGVSNGFTLSDQMS